MEDKRAECWDIITEINEVKALNMTISEFFEEMSEAKIPVFSSRIERMEYFSSMINEKLGAIENKIKDNMPAN